jgi:MFS family permease
MGRPPDPKAPAPLFRNRNIRLLWISDTISQAGSAFTDLALPLTAVILLHATAGQMGLLYAVEAIPRVGLVLVGGVMADRVRRQPLLVTADVAAAFLIGSIPVAAAFDALTFAQLLIVAVLAGAMAGMVGPATAAFTPVVIPAEDLARANRFFHGTGGAVSIAMPPVAGAVITAIGAPFSMAFDAVSYLLSAALMGRIRVRESPPPPSENARRSDFLEGMRFLRKDPILWTSAACYAVWAFAGFGIVTTLYFLYVVDVLGVSAAWIGVVTAVGGGSLVLAAWGSRRLVETIGAGMTLVVGATALAAGPFLLPLAHEGSTATIPLLAASAALGWGGYFLLNVNLVTIRQSRTPERMLGRISAALQFTVAVAGGVGALVGGWLGGRIGLRPAILVAAVIQSVVPVIVAVSPLARLRALAPSSP